MFQFGLTCLPNFGNVLFMNPRLELLCLGLVLFAAFVFLLRSKTFDRFINNLFKGSKSTTASEFEDDYKIFNKSVDKAKEEADKTQERIKKEKKKLNQL